MIEGSTIGLPRRSLSVFQVIGLQIALVCVLGSMFGNFSWGQFTLGPAFLWAWIVGGLLQLCVALSIARLSAAYPRTGGCYQWLRMLGHERLAWFTGYLLLVGYLAAIADDDSGLADTLLSFAGVSNHGTALLTAVALACLAAQAMLSVMSVTWVARATMMGAFIQIAVIVAIVGALTLVGLRQPGTVLFQASGIAVHPHMPRFLLMLMIPVWTVTCFDAPANFADEAVNSRRAIPGALMLATGISLVLGTALIAVPLLAMPGAHAATSSASISSILTARIGSGFSNLSSVFRLLALFFQPVVLQLVAARMLWAQSLAGAWPATMATAMLDRRGVPVRATVLCGVVAAAIVLGWPAIYGLGTAWPALLALAYALTIAGSLAAAGKDRLDPPRSWDLGTFGRANDLLAASWCAFLVLLLPLFDALHAVPLCVVIIATGLLAARAGVGIARTDQRDMQPVAGLGQEPGA